MEGDDIPQERLLWYAARNTLLGFNGAEQNLSLALEMARKSTWPEAQVFASIFENRNMPERTEDLRALLCGLSDNILAITLGALLWNTDFDETPYLERAADAGNALAQVFFNECDGEADQKYYHECLKAAAQDEPEALDALGDCYFRGLGVERNLLKARECFQRAVLLLCHNAYYSLGKTYSRAEPERYVWFSKYAIYVNTYPFEKSILKAKKLYERYKSNPQIAYCIGRILYTGWNKFPYSIQFSWEESIEIHKYWKKCTQDAVNAWLIIARRKEVVRDIRQMIARMIWASRTEGLYGNDDGWYGKDYNFKNGERCWKFPPNKKTKIGGL